MLFEKRGFLRYILYILTAFAVSFIAEYTFNIDIDHLNNTISSKRISRELRLTDAELINCYSEDNTVHSEGIDPQIVFENIDSYVSTIIIHTDKLNYSVMPLQLFYSVDENGFDSDNCVSSTVRKDRRVLFLELNEYVQDLRIDIGNANDSIYIFGSLIVNPEPQDYLVAVLQNMSMVRMFLFFLISLTVVLALGDFSAFKHNLHRYRWIIGAVLIALFTLLRLHGSSFGRIAELMQGLDTGVLIGTNRAIRSDEYVVFTEMAISQVRSGFDWFSDIWGYSPSDMFIIYGQPVLNPVTLFRPFSIGYIFLGAEMGLSFYWISRIVIGILISYEFGRLITKDDRALSFLYSVMVIFSPVVQWWFSTNEFVEMLIAGQCAVLIAQKYIKTEGVMKKSLLSLGFVYCGGVYILSLYPAWMIPLIYVFFASFVALIYENRREIRVHFYDYFIWIGALIVFALCFMYIYAKSGDTINSILNTSYPGKRTYDGGPITNVFDLFRGWTSYIWSFIDADNACEEVCFLSFFPIGIVLSFIALFRKKIKDPWLISLGIVDVLLIMYSVIPLPHIVGVLTFLNKSLNTRIITVIGFLNLVILFRGLRILDGMDLRDNRIIMVLVSGISCVLSFVVMDGDCKSATIIVIALISAVFSGCMLSGFNKSSMKNIFITYCSALALIGGAMVNPVSRGISSVIEQPQILEISKINEADEGIWMTVGTHMFGNIPSVMGVDTASALDTYPDELLWNTIGLDDERDIWNRYAHKMIEVADETSIVLEQDDLITLYISVDDLRKLDVKYLFSIEDLSKFEGLECIYSYSYFDIYRVN